MALSTVRNQYHCPYERWQHCDTFNKAVYWY